MRLSRIYVTASLSVGESIDLSIASSHYIKNVLRLKNGQNIIIFNALDPLDYTARVEIFKKQVQVSVLSSQKNNLESPLHTSLFQAIGKPEHIDLVIQKATELGITKIHLFNSQRTQTHLKGPRLAKKIEHWQGIIISACEQCGRNQLPLLHFEPTFQSFLAEQNKCNKILLDFNGSSIKTLASELKPQYGFNLLVGPEGGFTPDEVQFAKDQGFKPCTLGPRVLRMETAAISIINIIQHHFGDMG